jgi:predicted  nucleic acid-binding Zn-ribbon protein
MTEEKELARLEGFVATLLEKFNALQAENVDLTERLGRREETIENLQDDLALMKDDRGEISSRVSNLIGKIEDWETTSAVSVTDSDDTSSEEDSSDSGVQGNLFADETESDA